MLDGDHQHAWEPRTGPFLEERIAVVLLHAFVAILRAGFPLVAVRAVLRDIGLVDRWQIWIGRRLTPSGHLALEMPVVDRERVFHLGMGVPSFGQEDQRA